MPISINDRLIRACRHTYDINPDGSLPGNPDADAIGYQVPLSVFVSGLDKIDGATVGQTDSEIIVAFRGTFPPTAPDHLQMILDWVSDFDDVLIDKTPGLPGKVHQGFSNALDALWPGMVPAIGTLVGQNPGKPLYVTGHSKGGAVANLAAMLLKPTLPATTAMSVVTFAAPRAGDQDFANAYANAIAQSDRYEYADDLVPHVPPSDAFVDVLQGAPDVFNQAPELAAWLQGLHIGYVSVGDLHFINWSGEIQGDSALLRLERLSSLVKLMVKGLTGFSTIAEDHSIGVDSGYYNGILSLPGGV